MPSAPLPWRLALAAAACLLVAACGGGDDEAADTTSTTAGPAGEAGTAVAIADFNFGPEALSVAAGDTVTWTNEDDATHSVKDNSDLGYESEDLAQGDTFEQTFDEAGEYPYVCGIHSYMKGSVTVE